jgi:hypothetical protein
MTMENTKHVHNIFDLLLNVPLLTLSRRSLTELNVAKERETIVSAPFERINSGILERTGRVLSTSHLQIYPCNRQSPSLNSATSRPTKGRSIL